MSNSAREPAVSKPNLPTSSNGTQQSKPKRVESINNFRVCEQCLSDKSETSDLYMLSCLHSTCSLCMNDSLGNEYVCRQCIKANQKSAVMPVWKISTRMGRCQSKLSCNKNTQERCNTCKINVCAGCRPKHNGHSFGELNVQTCNLHPNNPAEFACACGHLLCHACGTGYTKIHHDHSKTQHFPCGKVIAACEKWNSNFSVLRPNIQRQHAAVEQSYVRFRENTTNLKKNLARMLVGCVNDLFRRFNDAAVEIEFMQSKLTQQYTELSKNYPRFASGVNTVQRLSTNIAENCPEEEMNLFMTEVGQSFSTELTFFMERYATIHRDLQRPVAVKFDSNRFRQCLNEIVLFDIDGQSLPLPPTQPGPDLIDLPIDEMAQFPLKFLDSNRKQGERRPGGPLMDAIENKRARLNGDVTKSWNIGVPHAVSTSSNHPHLTQQLQPMPHAVRPSMPISLVTSPSFLTPRPHSATPRGNALPALVNSADNVRMTRPALLHARYPMLPMNPGPQFRHELAPNLSPIRSRPQTLLLPARMRNTMQRPETVIQPIRMPHEMNANSAEMKKMIQSFVGKQSVQRKSNTTMPVMDNAKLGSSHPHVQRAFPTVIRPSVPPVLPSTPVITPSIPAADRLKTLPTTVTSTLSIAPSNSGPQSPQTPTDKPPIKLTLKRTQLQPIPSKPKEKSPDAEKPDEPDRWDDYCYVCNQGCDDISGELVCCESCPKVYHNICHVPRINCDVKDLPDTWKCTRCVPITQLDDVVEGFRTNERLICARILLCCYEANEHSEAFHNLVPQTVKKYYEVISKPICLKDIGGKVSGMKYKSVDEFIVDMNQVFMNCCTFNKRKSPVELSCRKVYDRYQNAVKKYLPKYHKKVWLYTNLHRTH